VTDIAHQSASVLAEALRAKEVSSRELLALYLDRIERLNPAINAVVTLDEERAYQRADEADEALARGEVWGPLHGLPMTVKDAFETAGLRTTGGITELSDHVPDTDADAIARLRAAGAVIFGKTNVPAGSADWQSFNDIFGTTNNPWDVSRTPGGSSGGSAAAVAAGFTGFEIGSDLAGSIRTPCGWSGVYGLKPTHGIVPSRGHIPGSPGTLAEMDLGVMGPIGRSADDLDLGLDVLAGPNPARSIAWRLDLPAPRATALRDFRVAAWLDDPLCPVEAEVVTIMEAAVEAIRGAGAQVDDTARPVDLEESWHLYLSLLMGMASSVIPAELFDELVGYVASAPDDGSDGYRTARLMTQRARDWQGFDEERHQTRRRWASFFQDHDVLLCPVVPTVAIPHDHAPDQDDRKVVVNGESRAYDNQMTMWSGPTATMPLLPSAMVPIGRTRAGLPVGIQVVAPYLEDRTAVAFARAMADVVGGFDVPPGF